ncbi:homing endonuclease [Jimgerdemannia flammicorona]|uniref:Homing endonuclease n=1 Tax=Jimgerdemannia flammicorona TaxID=994334 RepID=A0A433QXC0_9FUNG|nr:homing endonuclease [Jimgerdemannia flammicorona]
MGVKLIPEGHIMYLLLSPIALAHWIMSDGQSHGNLGLFLCTHSFSIPDVVRLMNVLMVRYNLDCTLRMDHGKYPMIYIQARSMPKLQTIVSSYMDPSMLYQIQHIPPKMSISLSLE